MGFYCAACCVPAFCFGPLIELIGGAAHNLSADILIFSVLLAAAVGGAFCFYIPLLYFHHIVPRVAVSVALPSIVWMAAIGGIATIDYLGSSGFYEGYKLFLVALAGGGVPAGVLVWCRSWRLYHGSRGSVKPANRLIDIFVLMTACAAFFAILRSGSPDAWPVNLSELAAFATLGAAAGMPSLAGIGAVLHPRPSWKYRSNWAALLLSLVVVFGGWTVPFLAFGDPPNREPMPFWLALSCSTWLVIVATVVISALWFRRFGLRLTTSGDRQAEVIEPEVAGSRTGALE